MNKAFPAPASFYQDDYDYVLSCKGDSFTTKLRSLIQEHRRDHGEVNGLLVFEKKDGETIWADELPFVFNKKLGWRRFKLVAIENGYYCRVIEEPESGDMSIYIEKNTACDVCKEKLRKVVDAL